MSAHWRVLSMWNPELPAVYEPLEGLAQLDLRPSDRDYLLRHLGDYDVYLATLKVRLDDEIIARAAAGRLKLVYTPSTGLDHLDLDALAAHGIELRSIKTELECLDRVTATAELAVGLMLAVIRKIPAGHASVMAGDWGRDRFRGRQIAGQTLGVLGVGRLGRMMVRYGRGLGMDVIGCDPSPLRPLPDLPYLDFDDFAARCDVMSVHMHLNEQTARYLDRRRLAQLKPGAVIINTSRGGLVDEAALIDALASDRLAGYGTDVIDGEWRSDLAEHPLIAYARDHDHVVITPHVGGVTIESQALTHRFVVEQVADILRGWPSISV